MAKSADSPLDGIWQMIRAESGGERAPELFTQKTQIEFCADEYIVRFNGEITDRGTFERVDHDAHQAAALLGIEGTNAGRIIPCIYQIAGNRLRICFGLDGAAPAGFDQILPGQYFASYRRQETSFKAESI